MIRRLGILLGILSLTYFTACGGGDEDKKPPPKPPPMGADCMPVPPPIPGMIHTAGAGVSPFGSPMNGPSGMGVRGIFGGSGGMPPKCHELSPQDLNDLQNHFARAKQSCCSALGPFTTQAAATFQMPGVMIPPPQLGQCDNDVRLAQLLANTMYAPWGGSAFPPLAAWIKGQGKAVVNCIASSAGLSFNSPPQQLAHAFRANKNVLQSGAPNLYGMAAMPAEEADRFFQQLLALQ